MNQNLHISISPSPRLLMLRGLLIGLLLFFYAQLRYERHLPPYVFIIQAMVLVTLSSWALWKLKRRERLAPSPLALPFIGVLGATTLATFWSVDARRSADGLFTILALVLFFFLISDLLQKGWSPDLFVAALLWFATFAIALGMWYIGSHYWQGLLNRAEGYPAFLLEYRLFGVFDHPNFLAPLITLALPFAIIRLAHSRTGWERVGWGIWIWAYETVLFFTRSRGGWGAALISAVFIVCWLLLESGLPYRVGWRRWGQRTGKIFLVTILAFGWFVLLWRAPDLQALIHASGSETARSTFSTNSSATIAGTLQNHRMVLWNLAWEQFLAHPFTGSGPLTFAHAYVNHMWSVRLWVPAHAHSLYFEILGTQGIVGILALFWLIITGAIVFGRGLWLACKLVCQNQMQEPPYLQPYLQYGRLVWGVGAALSGYLVHSLVDVAGKLASNDLVVVMLVAVGGGAVMALQKSAGSPAPPESPESSMTTRPMIRPMARWTMGMIIPGVIFILFRYGSGHMAMQEAINAAMQGDWPAAAQAMDKAVTIDPQFSFYWGQRGYVYSILAAPLGDEDDSIARARAIESYATAITIAPAYVPHLLNMAALLEQAGLHHEAMQTLEQAVALPQSTYWALPSLLLAEAYGNEGKEDLAWNSIQKAVASEPHALEMAACQRNTFCRTIAHTSPPTYAIHLQARNLLEQGYPQQALVLLDTISLSNAEPFPWFDRAHAHLALGEQTQAQYAFGVGNTLWYDNPYTSSAATYAAMTNAALLQARGEYEPAIRALESSVLMRVVGDGYSYSVFERVGLPGQLQPRLDLLQRTADDLEIYRQLEQWYGERGSTQRATWARTRANILADWLNQRSR